MRAPYQSLSPSRRREFVGYLGGTTVVATAVVVVALCELTTEGIGALGPGFWLVAALLLGGELRPVVASGVPDPNGVSLSSAFIFAILFHWGPWPAIVLQALTMLAGQVLRRREWWRVLFNVAQHVVCVGAAALLLAAFDRLGSPAEPLRFSAGDLLPMTLCWAAYFLLNLALVGKMLSILSGTPFWDEFTSDFWFYAVTTFAVLVLSPVFVIVISEVWEMIPLLLLPLFLVYKTASISREKEHQALHDALTGLPNRKLLVKACRQALADAALPGRPLALCLLDLDRFKEVNDTLGHHAGDRLLEIAAARLHRALRPGDVVARLGGDEFAVLLPEVGSPESAVEVAERIKDVLSEPYHVDGMLLEVTASIGVAVYPHHGRDVDTLLRHADVAMYQAKETRGGVELYSPDRDEHSLGRLALLAELRRGISAGELVLHYQPKLRLPGGEVAGLEALVRWAHPERGLTAPDQFLHLAEQAGLMPEVTSQVLDQALAQLARWWRDGLRLPVAINVSLRDLTDPGFSSRLADGLARHDLPAEAVELEVTEHVLMTDPERSATALNALARLGVRLSLDDFGTGYSSLVHLKRFPVSEIKIDRSFVSRVTSDPDDAAIVRSIVELGHALGLRVVAEGVEDETTWDRLCAMGVDAAQGWLFCRAIPAAAVPSWLERYASRESAVAVTGAAAVSAGQGRAPARP